MSTEYVLPTVLDCAHVAQVIIVSSGTYRKEQQGEVSSCYAHFMRELHDVVMCRISKRSNRSRYHGRVLFDTPTTVQTKTTALLSVTW